MILAGILKPYIVALQLAAAALLLIGTNYLTWRLTSDSYIKEAQQQQIARDQASAKLIADRDAQILQGGIQHAKDQRTITDLAARNRSMQIHFPTAGCGVTQGGADSDRAGGILSAGVDAAFAELQKGAGILVQRCDQLNIDAIQSNTANK